MFKKLVIIILIITVVALATIPLWTSNRADGAFANPNRKGSPGIVKDAMLVNIRIHRYEQARILAEKGVLYFPHSRELPYFIYNAGKCAEQERRPYVAVYWYDQFLKKYPKHMWSKQAQNSMTKLKELHTIE